VVTALAAYFALLVLPTPGIPDWVQEWFAGDLVCVLAAAVLVDRVRTHPAERLWVVPLCLGVLLFVLGANVFFLFPGDAAGGTLPAVTALAYLAVFPCLLAGILLALRQHLRHLRLIVALDGVTGALAGAAVTACVVAPLAARVWDGSPGALLSLTMVLGDGVLIAGSLGALAVVGLRNGRNFAVWALGMLVYTVGDLIYSYLLAYDRYEYGTWVDSLWALGLALVAIGATLPGRPDEGHVPPARSLVVVTACSVAAVLVLVFAPDRGTNPVPALLALCALTGAGVRFGLAFVQLRELAVVRAQALTDELTGAGNRRALYQRLDDAFETVEDDGPATPGFALALVDLDRFKEVNDSLGHATGDELLQTVVARFAGALDELGSPHLLTRLGGDEFAVVVEGVETADAAMVVGTALRESLVEPIALGRAVLHARASVGVALAPEHGRTRSDILFAADAAMYESKTSGDAVRLHSPDGVGDRRTRLAIAEELYTALERRELTVAYQPICSPTGRLLAAEALVRWDHPERGRLEPADFLETAERYRLTQLIAERVLDVTLSDLARWRRDDPHLTVSVNISASDLRDESIVAIVASALLAHRLPPRALTIEVTETAMMRDPKMAQTVMRALADLGVELSVDDYGTGYSSLEYLLDLPVDEIKLDRAFSAGLACGLRSVEIVRSTVDLTHALGLRMVAEGVEDEQGLEILRNLGCDRVQGWHLGRPLPAGAFGALVAEQAGHRTATG
jgi:diguanylate cyclase (GGDEF)-like protein